MKKNKFLYLLSALALLASCKKEFIDRPSENGPTLDIYYNSAAEVNAATGYLYNAVWANYEDKAFHAIGEVLGGNALTSSGDVNYGSNSYVNFTVLSTDPLVSSSWRSFYKVAGNATVLITTFEQKKGSIADPAYLDQGIAESRFIRGVAYFDIARTFGDVPIISDPVALAGSGDYNVPRYFQKDVLRFALEDLKAAESVLSETPYAAGRVSKYSAIGMEAKIYLYRATMLGTTEDYDSARIKAKEVIDYATSHADQVGLYEDYEKMFTSSSANNNKESLFALQWIAAATYGGGNPLQIYQAPSTLLKPVSGNGYSSVIPSIDLLAAYEPGDNRRKWSVMEQGFTRTDWTNVNFPNGFTYDTSYESSNDDPYKIKTGTRSNILKYVVGTGSNGEPVASTGHTSICTYVLRYADVLLIYAEAVAGSGGATSEGTAVAAFNQVHTRAGLDPVTSLTKDMILHERRVEFAFEGDYWFDVQRQGFQKASAIINAQERGTYNYDGSSIQHVGASFTSESQLFLPIPQTETVSDPKLLEPAVAYY